MNIEDLDLDLDALQEAGIIDNVKFDRPDFVEPGRVEDAFVETVHLEFVGEKLTGEWDTRHEGRRNHLVEMVTGEPHFVGKTKDEMRTDAARDAIQKHFESASSHRKLNIMSAISQAPKK